jgi:hypothetical protein
VTLLELQSRLDHLGVKLSARGDRLCVDPPKGVMTAEIKTALADHKLALMAGLTGLASSSPPAPPLPWPPRPVELASWPVEWRERWGRLANQLEDWGMRFPECEREAYIRIKAERERHGGEDAA